MHYNDDGINRAIRAYEYDITQGPDRKCELCGLWDCACVEFIDDYDYEVNM